MLKHCLQHWHTSVKMLAVIMEVSWVRERAKQVCPKKKMPNATQAVLDSLGHDLQLIFLERWCHDLSEMQL